MNKKIANILAACTIILIVVVPFALVILIGRYIWSQIEMTPQRATVLLQEVVDGDPDHSGQVSNVTLSGAVCTQVTLGNSCRVDVTFRLDGRAASGWCTYGLRQTSICAITGFLGP